MRLLLAVRPRDGIALDAVYAALCGMAFWMTEVPGGGFAMGEAPDEAEARLTIAREQGRASVSWNERAGRYRWTVVLDGGKSSHGWAESEAEGWWFVKEAVFR